MARQESRNAALEAWKDEERETRQAIVEDADKTEGKDRDLVHGDGGTLGLGPVSSMNYPRPDTLEKPRFTLK